MDYPVIAEHQIKRLVIVEHRAKGLANQLWNDMSIYAYGLSAGVPIINLTAFEHIRFWHLLHQIFARAVDIATRKTCGIWTTGAQKLLPPSAPLYGRYLKCDTLYFFGWLFRNPIGLDRNREALISRFSPKERTQREIDRILSVLPADCVRVGIHMQQQPFKGFEQGEFLVSPARVKIIVEEYLLENALDRKDVALVVSSDREVSQEMFKGFTTVVSKDDEYTRLFLLSKCSVVIGTNSTFSNLAAWFANVAHVVTTDEPIDWVYYRGKKGYFENKYATFAHGSL